MCSSDLGSQQRTLSSMEAEKIRCSSGLSRGPEPPAEKKHGECTALSCNYRVFHSDRTWLAVSPRRAVLNRHDAQDLIGVALEIVVLLRV